MGFRNAQSMLSSPSRCITACLCGFTIISCNILLVCFSNAQRTLSSSSSHYATSCLSVSGTHKECSVHHHLTMQHPACLFHERTKNAQFIIISLCNILFVCFRNAQRTLSSSSSLYVTTCLSWRTGWSASTRRTTAPSPSPSTPIACSSLFRKSMALPKCLLVRLRAVDDANLVLSKFRGNRQNFSLCKYPKFCCSANTLQVQLGFRWSRTSISSNTLTFSWNLDGLDTTSVSANTLSSVGI